MASDGAAEYDREDEHNPDVHISELLDDEDIEALEPGSGGPMASESDRAVSRSLWSALVGAAIGAGVGAVYFGITGGQLLSVAFGAGAFCLAIITLVVTPGGDADAE